MAMLFISIKIILTSIFASTGITFIYYASRCNIFCAPENHHLYSLSPFFAPPLPSFTSIYFLNAPHRLLSHFHLPLTPPITHKQLVHYPSPISYNHLHSFYVIVTTPTPINLSNAFVFILHGLWLQQFISSNVTASFTSHKWLTLFPPLSPLVYLITKLCLSWNTIKVALVCMFSYDGLP